MKLTTEQLRELDARIAENVFGWAWYSAMGQAFLFPPNRFADLNGFSVHWERGLHSEGWTKQEPDKKESKKCFSPTSIFGNDNEIEIPHYSTDPAAAMEVLKKCAAQVEMTINWLAEIKEFRVGGYIGFEKFESCDAVTLELAICLFAKKLFAK